LRRFKIIFSFYQIVAQLGQVYSATFPPAYNGIINVVQAVTFRFTAIFPTLPLECAFPELANVLIFTMLAPFAVVAVAIAIGAIDAAIRSQDRASLTAASLLLPSLPFVLVWTFVVLTPVSSLAFRALAHA
jgi:hypothetical protein